VKKFNVWKNIRKALIAGITSYLIAFQLGFTVENSALFGVLGLLGGSAVNVYKFKRG
jgi:hypothetical protein